MWIFFCLGNSNLSFTCFGKYLSNGVGDIVFVKNDMYPLKRIIVICHRHKMKITFLHSMGSKILLVKGLGQLSPSVCSEIKKHHHITILNGCNRLIVSPYSDVRFYKLICRTTRITLLDGFNKICCCIALTMNQKIISLFYSFPTFVSIHGIVAPND